MYNGVDHSSYIEHHGVAGQKWGKRNGPPYPLTRSVKTTMKKRKAKKEKAAEQRRKVIREIKSLSDSEINRRIRRLEDENKLAKLMGESAINTSTEYVSRGKKIASRCLDQIGDKVLIPTAVGLTVVGLKTAFRKKYGKLPALSDDVLNEIFKTVNQVKKK